MLFSFRNRISVFAIWAVTFLCLLYPLRAFPVSILSSNPVQSAQEVTRSVTASDQAAFERAMAAMNGGDVATAETLLQGLSRRYPQNFEINESLGLLYAGESKLRRAMPLLVAAAAEQSDSDVAHANLGIAYLKLRKPKQAAVELQRAAQLNPANLKTKEALGQAWMLLHQPDKAARAFNEVLAAGPQDSDLIYNDALAEFDAGHADKAAALLARMEDVTSSASAQSLYGDVEEKLGHYKDATLHYADAITLDPSESNVYVLGIEFLRHWTFDAAIKEFAAGAKKFPDSERMRRGLAIAYYGNGNYDQAIPILADLLDTHPDNAMYADLFGRSCTVLTEDVNARCSSLIQFAQKHPQNATLSVYAAISILHRPTGANDLQTAKALLQHAIAADPKLAQARMEMGVLLQTESKWAESVAPLEVAIRLKPDYAQAHYRLARAYSHLGKHAEAQQQIALDQQYSKKQEQSLDARMKEITTLVVKMQ